MNERGKDATGIIFAFILISPIGAIMHKKWSCGRVAHGLLFFVLMAFLIAPHCQAKGLSAAIFDIAPWGYLDNDGNIAGIEYEIISAIAEEMAEDIDIQLVPYKRMLENLEAGVVDFAIFYRSAKSEQSGEPLAKWGKLDIIVVGRAGTDLRSYEDLRPLTVAVRLGGLFDPHFNNDATLKKLVVDNYAHGLKMLMAKRVDAVIGTAATLFYECQNMGVPAEELGVPFIIASTEDWLHISRKSAHQDKKEKIARAVHKLVGNGTFARIFSKYLPKKWQHY